MDSLKNSEVASAAGQRLTPYTKERTDLTARLDEASAENGMIQPADAERASSVYTVKLGLQSMKTVISCWFHELRTSSTRLRIQV